MAAKHRPRPATADDFRAFFECEPPPLWIGVIAEDVLGAIVAAGVVKWDEYGRAWGSYTAKTSLPCRTIHRAARRCLAILESVGEPVLYVYCDKRVDGAERWLDCLGFMPSDLVSPDPNFPVWERRWLISE